MVVCGHILQVCFECDLYLLPFSMFVFWFLLNRFPLFIYFVCFVNGSLSFSCTHRTDVVIASSLPCDVESEILLSVTCYGPCSVPYPRPVNVDTLSSTVYIYVNYVASQQSNAAANGTIQWSAGQAALCKPVDSDFCGSFYSVQKVVDTDALDMVRVYECVQRTTQRQPTYHYFNRLRRHSQRSCTMIFSAPRLAVE